MTRNWQPQRPTDRAFLDDMEETTARNCERSFSHRRIVLASRLAESQQALESGSE